MSRGEKDIVRQLVITGLIVAGVVLMQVTPTLRHVLGFALLCVAQRIGK